MRVGVTGGIGSGKTAICKVFETYGIPVFNADAAAKSLYSQPEIVSWVKNNIAEDVYNEKNELDRAKLASLIFQDEKKLKLLESKIHPSVGQMFSDWYKSQCKAPYVIYEAAILFETGRYKELDLNILVTAPLNLRIERVMRRDKVSENEIVRRISRQWEDEKKIPLANYVINNIDWSDTLIQIALIHEKILKKISTG